MRIYDLNNFSSIINSCANAQTKKLMIGIIGYPGAGKTAALQYYSQNNRNVYYLRVRKSMTAKDFYIRLLESMGLKNTMRELPIHFIMNKIAGNLNLSTKPNLIIIDEAGKFKPKQLEYIHELRDMTDGTTGIVLAGPEYFRDNLDSWKKDNVIGIPELHRRIFDFIELDRPKYAEVKLLCSEYGVKDEKLAIKIHREADNFASIVFMIYKELERRGGTEPN
ncbi:ATP-binding protein [Marivirga tractuosa]|uniref:AAA family ATPase n=1 Tax=Marivirga tractuosa TaxID=1006 RepID=UPI0035CE9A93